MQDAFLVPSGRLLLIYCGFNDDYWVVAIRNHRYLGGWDKNPNWNIQARNHFDLIINQLRVRSANDTRREFVRIDDTEHWWWLLDGKQWINERERERESSKSNNRASNNNWELINIQWFCQSLYIHAFCSKFNFQEVYRVDWWWCRHIMHVYL